MKISENKWKEKEKEKKKKRKRKEKEKEWKNEKWKNEKYLKWCYWFVCSKMINCRSKTPIRIIKQSISQVQFHFNS